MVRLSSAVNSVDCSPTSVWVVIFGRMNTLPAPGIERGPRADTTGRSGRMSS
jgi:hypothetical protein